ncbi:MAG: 16S rRNA (cytosine(967)-C(5))-methyltransferase RsmB [Lactovum sp.]
MKIRNEAHVIYQPRRVALEILCQVFTNGAYANIALDKALSEARLSELDRNFVTAIVYGTISKKLLLENYLSPFLKKTKAWLHLLLLMTAYQILYMDKIPTSAAIDEAVKIAKIKGGQDKANFINAVLRNFSRSPLLAPKDFGTKYSLPDFLVQKFIAQFGKERAVRIFESLEKPSHVSLRCVDPKLKIPQTRPSELVDGALISDKGNFSNTEAFKKGQITIQDETSQLVAQILSASPNDQILDTCAAPGGKSCHIASYLEKGKVTAVDIHVHKLKLIQENARRLHVEDKIKTLKADARELDQYFTAETFDKILVDAPCSGLGLMRRKPDIKYRKNPEDFKELQELQLEILASSAKLLKKNAIMVYSTCTLADEENFELVQLFLKAHSDFEQIEIKHEKLDIIQDGCIYISPELYHTDGFFIAKFRKK